MLRTSYPRFLPMRTKLALCALLALAAVACSDDPSAAADLCAGSGAAATVSANDNFTFTPASVTVNVGQAVCWANTGNMIHTATQGSAGQIPHFNGNLPAGQAFVFTFTLGGNTFGYHCNNHSNMTGTVIVNP